MKIPKTDELFDLGHTLAESLLSECEYPYEALSRIGEFIDDIKTKLGHSYLEVKRDVFIAEDAMIWDGATVCAPAIIGHGAEVRPGAFIRGKVIVGDGAVIGNSSEVKNSIIFDEGKLPHYNYAGDSIIGYRAHMGAGSIASNLRLDKKCVSIRMGSERKDTSLKKFGAMVGDYAEVGCGAILCPGTIICREAMIYPQTTVIGVVGEKSVYRDKNDRRI